jgi:hypothetical protein
MADTKLADLTALTTPSGDDILYIVDDPAGTPLDRKIALDNLFTRGTLNGTLLNMSQTWGGTGTYTGIKYDVTDSGPSNAASLLMDLQVGGTSRFSVTKGGKVNASAGVNIGGAADNATLLNGSGYALLTNVNGGSGVGASQYGQSLATGGFFSANATRFGVNSNTQLAWSNSTDDVRVGSATFDLLLTRRDAANLRLGAADTTGTTAPTPQFLSAQSWASSTTNNQTGANFTIDGSQGTGTGAGGSIIFRVAPAGGTSNGVQNGLSAALTINSARDATFEAGVFAASSSPSAVAFGRNGTAGTGIYFPSAFNFAIALNGTGAVNFTADTLSLPSNSVLQFLVGAIGSTPDTKLFRDAANTLALRNANDGQTFRLYGRFTDITNNFERFFINAPTTSGDAVQLGTQKGATTGAARALEFQTDATSRWSIGATTGHLLAATDNLYDIGTSSGNRPRDFFLSRNFLATGFVAGSYLRDFNNRFHIYSGSTDGTIVFYNQAENNFDRMMFGGTTSSFPALKRSSASLIVRLADDTANAALESASLKTDAPTGGTAATWKLGTVASVTPTLQNRTIEVDIGGTIYYISAKTTND